MMQTLFLRFLFAAETASAQLNVSSWYRGDLTWSEAIDNIIDTLAGSIYAIGAACFMVGALQYTLGFAKEENQSAGKTLMISSLVGVALVMATQAIFNTVLFFLYG